MLDLASGGRISFVAGVGYRYEEFEMAGVDRKQRGKLLEEYVDVMRKAWTGEPFEWRGRTVHVTPKPLTQPHPMMMIGGSTEVAARRAARLRSPDVPGHRRSEAGRDLRRRVRQGRVRRRGSSAFPPAPASCTSPRTRRRRGRRSAPTRCTRRNVYESWQTPGQRSAVDVHAKDVDDVRKSGVYRVVTPDECVELAAGARRLRHARPAPAHGRHPARRRLGEPRAVRAQGAPAPPGRRRFVMRAWPGTIPGEERIA